MKINQIYWNRRNNNGILTAEEEKELSKPPTKEDLLLIYDYLEGLLAEMRIHFRYIKDPSK